MNDKQLRVRRLERKLTRQPRNASTLNDLAVARRDLGRYQEALSDFTAAMELAPNEGGIVFNRAFVLFQLERYEEALTDYNRAYDLGLIDVLLLNNRGYTLYMLGRHAEALDDFNRAVALEPDDIDCIANRGYCLSRLNRFSEAIADFDLVQTARPGDLDTLRYRAVSLARLGFHERAVSDYTLILEGLPDDDEAHFSRALVLIRLDKLDEALADLDAAISRQDADSDAARNSAREVVGVLWRLADRARRGNQPFAAIEHYDEIIRRNRWRQEPEFESWVAEAMMDKGKLLLRMGYSAEARLVMSEFENRYGTGRAASLVLRSWRVRAVTLLRRLRSRRSGQRPQEPN